MRGLLYKTLRETWLLTLSIGIVLPAVLALLTLLLPQIHAGLGSVLDQMPFVRSMLKSMLGTELGEEITARAMQAVLWGHPTVLTLIWAHEIVFCTRMPAGEIDRGTIDVLFGLPISRRTAYYCDCAMWLVSGALILFMGFLGHRLAAQMIPTEFRPEFSRAVMVIANLFGVYVAVGGIAFLVSAVSARRGQAMAIVVAVVVASFLLSFVAHMWEPARHLAFLSVLEYYQPARILRNGTFPVRDTAILLGLGATSLLLGGEIVARRSICTV